MDNNMTDDNQIDPAEIQLDLSKPLAELTFSDEDFMAFPDAIKAELLKANNPCAWRAVNYRVVENAFLNDNRIRFRASVCGVSLDELKNVFYEMVMTPGNMDKLMAKCKKNLIGLFRNELLGYMTARHRKQEKEVEWPIDEDGRPMELEDEQAPTPYQETVRKEKVAIATQAVQAGYEKNRLGIFVVVLRTLGMEDAEIREQLELGTDGNVRQIYSRTVQSLCDNRRRIEKGYEP